MKMIDVVVFLIAIAQISADSDVASLLKKRYNSPKATGPFGILHNTEQTTFHSEFGLTSTGRLTPLDFNHDLSAITATGTVTVTPTTYEAGDSLTVTWSNVNCPNTNDWIGVYATNLYQTPSSSYDGYIDWNYVSSVSTTWSQGFGTMTFTNVMNLRTPLEFKYYTKNTTCGKNADSTWSLLATSPDVYPENVNEPTQVHIAIGNNSSQMIINFVTNSGINSIPVVNWGLSESDLTNSATGSTTTYTASMMCSSPATSTASPYFSNPGFMHSVTITDLLPQTTYYYQVGVSEMSETFTFVTGPKEGTTDATVRIMAFGDMGSYQTGTQGTISRMKQHFNDYDIVLHIGDITYAEGEGIYWDVFGNLIQDIASAKPYMVSIGNHEYDHTSGGQNDPSLADGQGYHPSWGNYGSDSGGECGVPTYYRFSAPQTTGSNTIFWYAFPYGSAYIIQISSEHDFSPASTQYVWLESTLSGIDRLIYPWIILTTHRPMYCSENYASDYRVAVNMQSLLEPLLLQYKVDVVLAGHYHSYERTCAVNNNNCVQSSSSTWGIVHVVIGMAGMSLDTQTYLATGWSIFHDQAFGYSTLSVNSSTLVFNYYHNDDDAIYDSFTLTK